MIENIEQDMIPDTYVEKLASFFKSVSEENRVRIIYALSKQELCVNDLAAALRLSQSLVSHQLKILKLEGQVKSRREGKNIYYSLDDQHVVDIFEEALKHIKHRVEEGKDEVMNMKKRTVLVVDDSGMMLRTIKGVLEKEYEVSLANSAMKAFAAIENSKPDVILLDYEMPVCDGKMMFEMLRGNPETEDIPVFFLTAVAEKEKIVEVLELQPEGYILKPIAGKKIISRLEEFFNGGE